MAVGRQGIVAFPVFEAGAGELEAGGAGAEGGELGIGERGEGGGDADVVFNLAEGGAAEGEAVNGEAEDVVDAFADAEALEEFGVGGGLHGLDAEVAFDGFREDVFFEAEVGGVGGVEGHEDGVVVIVAAEHGEMDLGVAVAGEADEAAEALLFRLFEGFDGAAGGEDAFDVGEFADGVDLPEVDVVGAEAFEAEFEFAAGAGFVAAFCFGGEEDIFADGGQGLAEDFFAAATPIGMGAIEVIDAESGGAAGDGESFLEGNHTETATGLADDGELLAGFAEDAGGDGGARGEGGGGGGGSQPLAAIHRHRLALAKGGGCGKIQLNSCSSESKQQRRESLRAERSGAPEAVGAAGGGIGD